VSYIVHHVKGFKIVLITLNGASWYVLFESTVHHLRDI